MLDGMKNTLKSCGRRRVISLMVAMLLAATGLTVGASAWHSLREAPAKSLPAATVLQTSTSEQGVIRLLTSGFNPTEVTGSAGQYRLVLTRPGRDEQVVLQLKRASGELVQEINMPQGQADWTTLIELQAGSYTLTVNDHPNWVCSISMQ